MKLNVNKSTEGLLQKNKYELTLKIFRFCPITHACVKGQATTTTIKLEAHEYQSLRVYSEGLILVY